MVETKEKVKAKIVIMKAVKISEFLFYRKQDMVETKEKVKVKTK